jgi:hypothetical protein
MAMNWGRHVVNSNLQHRFPTELQTWPPLASFLHHGDEEEDRKQDPKLQHPNGFITLALDISIPTRQPPRTSIAGGEEPSTGVLGVTGIQPRKNSIKLKTTKWVKTNIELLLHYLVQESARILTHLAAGR